MTGFDSVLVVDWSANSTPKLGADSIWIGSAGAGAVPPENFATRALAMAALRARLDGALASGARVLVAFDIGFGFPCGFAERLTGRAEALAVWDWLAERITMTTATAITGSRWRRR
jgi:molybdopterin molybdotransferase